jgi:hypothetical protein
VHIALAALTGFDIEFQIRVGRGGVSNVVNCSRRERRSSQICVQDYSRRVDYRSQRILQRLPKLALDGAFEVTQRKVNQVAVEPACLDLVSQIRQHGPRGLGDCNLPFLCD